MDEPTIDHFEGITRNRSLFERLDADVTVPLERCRPFAGPLLMRGPVRDTSVFKYVIDNRGIWEPHLTRWVAELLSEGGDFVDAGANLGYFSIIGGALLAGRGNVISFEPLPPHFDYCVQNIALNRLSNVKMLPLGLWDKATSFEMTYHGDEPDHLGGARLLNPLNQSPSSASTAKVSCVAFDDLLDAREIVLTNWRLMKMDIEGAEPFALDGMSRALGRFRPVMTLELNTYTLKFFGLDESDVWDRLVDLDYRVMAMLNDGQHEAFSKLTAPLPSSRLRRFESLDQLREAIQSLNEIAPPCFPIDLVAYPSEKEL